MAFLTSKSATEKIETLENRVKELEASEQSAVERISELEQTIVERDATIAAHADQTETITSLNGQIETLTAARDKATADLGAAQASLAASEAKQADFDAKVDSAALAKFQSLGGDPVPASGKHDDPKPGAELTGLEKAIAIHKASKSKK